MEGLNRSDQVMIGINGNMIIEEMLASMLLLPQTRYVRAGLPNFDRAFIVSRCAERSLILRGSGWAYTRGSEAWRRQASATAVATRWR
jgi:hypothetical protein